jgi:hypothetical protein
MNGLWSSVSSLVLVACVYNSTATLEQLQALEAAARAVFAR